MTKKKKGYSIENMKTPVKHNLNSYATKQDLLATEDRLDQKIDKRIDGVIKYIDYKLELVDEFKKEFVDFKDRVMKTLDWLVGAFKKFDEEHTVMAEQIRKIADKQRNSF